MEPITLTTAATAIATLINLIGSGTDEFTRRLAAESLAEIAVGDQTAISTLVKLIDSARDEYIHEAAADSLGKIAVENQAAINTLIKLIDSATDESTRRQAANNLEKILTKPFMPEVVKALKNTANENAIKVLWHCAQNLSYPEFYSVWHS
jgi:HEAT repeat protein